MAERLKQLGEITSDWVPTTHEDKDFVRVYLSLFDCQMISEFFCFKLATALGDLLRIGPIIDLYEEGYFANQPREQARLSFLLVF